MNVYFILILIGIGFMLGVTIGINYERRDWNRVARQGKDALPLRYKRYM